MLKLLIVPSEEVKRGGTIISDKRPGGSGYKLIDDEGNQTLIDVQVLDVDSILYPFNQNYVLKIDTDGSDLKLCKEA